MVERSARNARRADEWFVMEAAFTTIERTERNAGSV
jgi:hypothetical protein